MRTVYIRIKIKRGEANKKKKIPCLIIFVKHISLNKSLANHHNHQEAQINSNTL